MLVGIGIGIGGRLGPSWLSSRIISRFGADLAALHLGDDILDTAGAVTAWPGRVGATMVNTGVSSFAVGAVNGHRAITIAASSDACLQSDNSAGAAVRNCIAVATTPAVVWPTYGTSALLNCGTAASGTAMQVQNGQTAFYTGSFWSHFVDGVASEATLPAGTHIFEGTTATGYTDTKYCKTGDAGGAWGWVGPRAFLMQVSRQITAGERSATVADLRRYYGI